MIRMNLVDPATISNGAKPALDAIEGVFGVVPNMIRAVANSPAALNSMWGTFGARGAGTLGPKLGEQIAVAAAGRNAGYYCLAAHAALGQKAGATTAEMMDPQPGRSSDPKTAAALTFAPSVVENRGSIAANDVSALRAVGFDDSASMEILAHAALNLFINYVNVASDAPVDFPNVKLCRAA